MFRYRKCVPGQKQGESEAPHQVPSRREDESQPAEQAPSKVETRFQGGKVKAGARGCEGAGSEGGSSDSGRASHFANLESGGKLRAARTLWSLEAIEVEGDVAIYACYRQPKGGHATCTQ